MTAPEWEKRLPESRGWWDRAREVLPDGVTSPVRGAFDPFPFYVARADGSHIEDVDGNRYIDAVMAFGPVILGHAHPAVTAAVAEQAGRGMLYGACTPLEVEVAEAFARMVPSAELVRFVPSGTEATMHALRVARGYTGKPKFLKFEGHYHGNHDQVLLSVATPLGIAGTEADPARVPVGSGIPTESQTNTLIAVWNDLEGVERVIRRHGHELAAVICEPIMANSGFIPPAEGYLQGLQQICRDNEVLFVLDEVITGFRLAGAGAQEVFGLQPDLSTFAKAMANGAPIGAFAGRREVMSVLEGGRVRHAGTYNAAPIALAAAKATMAELAADDGAAYRRLEKLGSALRAGLRDVIEAAGVPAIVQGIGSMLQIYFTELPEIRTYRQAATTDQVAYRRFAHEMISRGVFVHPDGFEHMFVSAAHTEQDVAEMLEAAAASLKALAAG